MSLPPRFRDKAQEAKALEVAREDVVGAFMLREGLDVVESLLLSRNKVSTRTFHFDDDGARN
ncbi:hypothetical protein M3B83_06920 [Dermabacter hominis]|nr:hypothetical protein [Dermabacter hominis]MCT1790166.1 hypothetical protein [Dermabacter hominis]